VVEEIDRIIGYFTTTTLSPFHAVSGKEPQEDVVSRTNGESETHNFSNFVQCPFSYYGISSPFILFTLLLLISVTRGRGEEKGKERRNPS